jgi:hypothetical protein
LLHGGETIRVLMVSDVAHVGYELSRELTRRGVEVSQLFFDPSLYPRFSFVKMVWKLREAECDLLHAHYCVSPARASYLSGKPYVVHCHGSDVRNGVGWSKRLCLERARKVLVATPDLLKVLPNAIYMPTPVGPQFHNLGLRRKGAAYFRKPFEKPPKIDWLNITVLDPVFAYEDMPKLLNTFEYFVDDSLPDLSKTALEALACGGKVVTWKGDAVFEGLPEMHRVEKVVDRLLPVYEEALKR